MLLLLIPVQELASADFDSKHPFWRLKSRDENRWLLEKALGLKYWGDHHKKAIKAAKEGNWGVSLQEYEAAVRDVGLSFRETKDDADKADVRQAEYVVLTAPAMNSLRFELALAYANRAEELHTFGRSSEADSLTELAVFFLESVKVYAMNRWHAGVSFSRLASSFSRLGRHDQAITYYRNALLRIEEDGVMTDPLMSVVNVRLGQEYLLVDKIYEAEPPLLRGTEFADSAAIANPKAQDWCSQLGAEGRAFLAETCRRLERYSEAESLYAESMQMALSAGEPMILGHCRPLFDHYATLLRERGESDEADSVNARTDRIVRRAELEIERMRACKEFCVCRPYV